MKMNHFILLLSCVLTLSLVSCVSPGFGLASPEFRPTHDFLRGVGDIYNEHRTNEVVAQKKIAEYIDNKPVMMEVFRIESGFAKLRVTTAVKGRVGFTQDKGPHHSYTITCLLSEEANKQFLANPEMYSEGTKLEVKGVYSSLSWMGNYDRTNNHFDISLDKCEVIRELPAYVEPAV